LLGLATLIPAKETHTAMLNDAGFKLLAGVPLSTVEGAIARMGQRRRSEGIAAPGLRALWSDGQRLAGYAVTMTMSVDESAGAEKSRNEEWWKFVESRPGPKVVVAQVRGDRTAGAACGVLTANVLRSLGCAGFVTDGYVRDAARMAEVGLLVAAAGPTLLHGAPVVVEFGKPVEIYGMRVATGQAVLADAEGVISCEAEWMAELPQRIKEVNARVDPVIAFCRGGRRSANEIIEAMRKR